MLNSYIGLSEKCFISVLIFSTIAFIAFSEFILRFLIVPIPNTEPYRAPIIYNSNSTKVAAGDSHIYRGFIKAKNITNLGRAGTSIHELDKILRLYYEIHSPGQLILEASHQFFSPLDRNNKIIDGGYENKFISKYLYSFEPVISSNFLRFSSEFTFKKNWNTLIKERLKKEKKDTSPIQNWNNLPQSKKEQKVKARVQKQMPKWDKFSERLVLKYTSLVKHLKKKGVSICLLRTPLTKEYIKIYEGNSSFSRSEKEFISIANENKIKYIDFRSIDIKWNPKIFMNQDHILPKFSTKFSKKAWEACFY